MIRHKVLFVLAVSLTLLARADEPSTTPELVDYPVTRTYIPVGYDSNDRVQVVVHGAFPNTCYKVGPYEVRQDQHTRSISIRQMAYRYGGVCMRMLVPFMQVIDIGMLRDGDYRLYDAVATKVVGRLPVSRATTVSADEVLYAPVSDVTIQDEGLTKYLVVSGHFGDACTRMKDVHIDYYPDVLVIRPIADRSHPDRLCAQVLRPFSQKVALRSGLRGNFLLHVRVLNGQAINKIFGFP